MTKNWVRGDLPYEAKIIYSTAALLTSTVYARLIFDRVSHFVKHIHFKASIRVSQLSRNLIDLMSSPRLMILLLSIVFLIAYSFVDVDLYSTISIRSAIVSALLGGVLYFSGWYTSDEFVKPVTRTLDLVGAPFLVAALLLANLLYLKI